MSARRWSLAGRLTRLFVLSTGVLVLAMSLASAWILDRSVNRELDLLTERMIKDIRLRVKDAQTEESAFVALTNEFALSHDNKFALRVWSAAWGNVRKEFGELALLSDEFPLQTPLDETQRVKGGNRWRTEPLGEGLVVGLVLDASPQLTFLRRYEMFAALAVASIALASLGAGTYLIFRVSKMLRRVAESARSVRQASATVQVNVEKAPDEVRDVADALQQLLDNIRAEVDRSRVFYASMAHELRSPIQNLVGATEVALIAQRDAETYRNVLLSNLEELRDLGDAIDNLVSICSNNEVVPGQRSRESFDLAEEARIRLAREQSRAERQGIGFSVEARGDLRMHGDREGILRALRNLAANAIEWSTRGDQVEVRLENKDGEVLVTVDDAGPGVSPELREKIFEPFFRGPTTNGRREGYGLGLAMVRSAVDEQGGKIEIDTSPAGGARFRLVLPRGAE